MEILQNRPPILISENRSSCPISTSLEIIGDHWSLVILRDFFLERNHGMAVVLEWVDGFK